MTAYEELKAWCEKHLGKSQWRATEEDEWGNLTIDIGEATHIFSQDTGRYLHTVFYNWAPNGTKRKQRVKPSVFYLRQVRLHFVHISTGRQPPASPDFHNPLLFQIYAIEKCLFHFHFYFPAKLDPYSIPGA